MTNEANMIFDVENVFGPKNTTASDVYITCEMSFMMFAEYSLNNASSHSIKITGT